MTNGEFKAWFEGFSEAIGELPTAEQWAKIKKRAAEIDDKTVTERVYILERDLDKRLSEMEKRIRGLEMIAIAGGHMSSRPNIDSETMRKMAWYKAVVEA